jgi:hypothetical protein
MEHGGMEPHDEERIGYAKNARHTHSFPVLE